MRPIEKMDLLESISIYLQDRMTYTQIDIYLSEFSIDTSKIQGEYHSRHAYVTDQLADVSHELILDIARDLDLADIPVVSHPKHPSHWKSGYFKLFLSHVVSSLKGASNLQYVLNNYAISSFVAHKDIKPTKKWQDEIEASLLSMDALLAILKEEFKESEWCDQEVGAAIGRDILIIPIMASQDPHGFIGKYQAIQIEGKKYGELAKIIFDTLISSPKTRSKMLRSLCKAIAQNTDVADAEKKLDILSNVKKLPEESLNFLRNSVMENNILVNDSKFKNKINNILSKYNIPVISENKQELDNLDDFDLENFDNPF